jgi:hypothetical protein
MRCFLPSGQNLFVEPGHQHIGQEHAAHSHIDRNRQGSGWVHGKLLERLAAAQQFAIDLADRF